MIAAIYGETNDTWIITTLIHGLEEWVKGFPDDGLIIVTNNKTVRAMAEARSRVSYVVDRTEEKPHVLFVIGNKFPFARIIEQAKKKNITTYEVAGV